MLILRKDGVIGGGLHNEGFFIPENFWRETDLHTAQHFQIRSLDESESKCETDFQFSSNTVLTRNLYYIHTRVAYRIVRCVFTWGYIFEK